MAPRLPFARTKVSRILRERALLAAVVERNKKGLLFSSNLTFPFAEIIIFTDSRSPSRVHTLRVFTASIMLSGSLVLGEHNPEMQRNRSTHSGS